ncbi:MAG: pilin [Patescibacteria group bacterium]|nr:pilin [Patescibacteria group bacterium]
MKKVLLALTILISASLLFTEDSYAYTWKPSCDSNECVGRQRDSDDWYACHTEGECGALTLGEPENYYCQGSAGWRYDPDACGIGGGGGGTGSGSGAIHNPMVSVEGITALSNYIGTFWQLAYIATGIIVLFYLIYGAVRFITAAGNEERVEQAQKTMTNAFIGLIILAASFPIIKIIEVVFGINILQIQWPTV